MGAPLGNESQAETTNSGPAYNFGEHRLGADGILSNARGEIHLAPLELQALQYLLANAGRIVNATELKKHLWGDVHVTADSVPRCISSLRSALLPAEYIQTVYKRGYRFLAPVERDSGSPRDRALRVVVLPFESGFEVPEHLGPVIAEEVIAKLSKAQEGARLPIVVLARDSAFALVRQGHTAVEAGKAMHADLVLTGGLRALPSRFRLRIEAIRVADSAQIWVEDFFVERTRLAGLEHEAMARLVVRLGAKPSSARFAEPLSSDPAKRAAWEHLQIGRHDARTPLRHRMEQGLQALLRATELDPSLVAAQIELANLCVSQAMYGFLSPGIASEQVRRTAKAVTDRQDGNMAILPPLGWTRFHLDHNLAGALAAFEAAAALPHDPWTTRSRVMFLLSRHRFAEAIQCLEEALQVDPYSPWLQGRLAWALHLAGESAQSLKQAEHALQLFPGHGCVGFYGAVVLAHNGHPDRALELTDTLVHKLPHFDLALAVQGHALASLGRTGEASEIVERLQWLSHERYVSSSFIPAILVRLGRMDDAIAELRAAEDARCPWFFQMLADPRLEPLRESPEYARMQRSLEAMEAAAAREMEPDPAADLQNSLN